MLPHALSSLVAKWLGESMWAWPLSPATALNFSSFPASSPSHALMILLNPFLSLLVLPAATTSSAQRGTALTSQCLYSMSFPAVAGPANNSSAFPFPTVPCCCASSTGTGTYPNSFHLLLPWACPELHQHQAPFFAAGWTAAENALCGRSPQGLLRFAPFSEDGVISSFSWCCAWMSKISETKAYLCLQKFNPATRLFSGNLHWLDVLVVLECKTQLFSH